MAHWSGFETSSFATSPRQVAIPFTSWEKEEMLLLASIMIAQASSLWTFSSLTKTSDLLALEATTCIASGRSSCPPSCPPVSSRTFLTWRSWFFTFDIGPDRAVFTLRNIP